LDDIRSDDKPFGGLIVAFGRNFCQILPIIVKGYKGKIVVASLRKSLLWDGTRILKLQQHMHLARTSLENQQLANWLRKVGYVHIPINQNGNILLPQTMAYGPNLLSFIQVVYYGIGDVNSHINEYFKDCIILWTWNDIVDNINNDIIDIFLGLVRTFLSANVAMIEIGVDNNKLYF
jgi:hypothetical protein